MASSSSSPSSANQRSMTGPSVGAADTTATNRLAEARSRWNKLAPRERTMVGVAASVLGAALLYGVAISPALSTAREAPARMASLDAQLQSMQSMAVESKELRGAPRMAVAQATAALKATTDTLGAAGRLSVVGDRATLTLTNASGDQLRRWLLDARTTARVRPVEATLTRGSGGFSGSVVVAFSAPS
jgi:general secretion pathway protein M